MTAWKSHAALRALLHAAGCCRRTLDKGDVPQSQVAGACLGGGNKRNVQHSLSHDLSHQHLNSLTLGVAQRCLSLLFLRSEPDVWWEEKNTTRYKLKLRKEGSVLWFYRFSWLHLLISCHTKVTQAHSMQWCRQLRVLTGKPAADRAALTIPTISVVSVPRISFNLTGWACLACRFTGLFSPRGSVSVSGGRSSATCRFGRGGQGGTGLLFSLSISGSRLIYTSERFCITPLWVHRTMQGRKVCHES